MSGVTAAQLLANGAQDLVSIHLRAIPNLGVGIKIVDLPGTDFYSYPSVFWRVEGTDRLWTGKFGVGGSYDDGSDSSRHDLDASLPAALTAAGFSGAIGSMCGNGEAWSTEGDVETAAQTLRRLGYQVSAVDENGMSYGDSNVADPHRWTEADWAEVYAADSGGLPHHSGNFQVDEVPEFDLRPSDDGSGIIVQIFRGYLLVNEGVGFTSHLPQISWRAWEKGSAASERRTAWEGEFFDATSRGVHPHSDDLSAALDFAGLHPEAMVSSRREAYSPNPDLEGVADGLRSLGYRVTISPAATLRGDDFS